MFIFFFNRWLRGLGPEQNKTQPNKIKVTRIFSAKISISAPYFSSFTKRCPAPKVYLPAVLVFFNVFKISTAMIFTWSLHSSLFLTRFLFCFSFSCDRNNYLITQSNSLIGNKVLYNWSNARNDKNLQDKSNSIPKKNSVLY